MSHRLFWRLCLIIAAGVVALFYMINELTTRTEEGMSMLAVEHRQAITSWGRTAEQLYKANDVSGLNAYIKQLQEQENTWVSVVSFDYQTVAGNRVEERYSGEQTFGRSVDWKIHLYFARNPVMEVSFSDINASFLIQLPDRMRPGSHWSYTKIALQIIIPTILLALLSYVLYRHIMKPLKQLQTATRSFSRGDFDVRAGQMMGERNDEFYELARTFDQMATRIGEQIISQRQLIADLSHELRTPLTRLDIALAQVEKLQDDKNVQRIARESKQIRQLVEDTLTLAWLENEQPSLQQETVDLVDLVDVLVSDATFEFADRVIDCQLPQHAFIKNSSHRAAGQAIENILRNALRYTPPSKKVTLLLKETPSEFQLHVSDQGPGVPNNLLQTIFKPFFRVDKSRENNGDGFGLGLALAKRQLAAIRADIVATNQETGGLVMTITLPKY